MARTFWCRWLARILALPAVTLWAAAMNSSPNCSRRPSGAGRYQLLPFCHQCKTTAHPAVSHGGRQPLQGRVSARGDQSPYRGCDFRREYVLFRIRRKYLADTGLPKERTYQTGSPMAEVLHMNLEKIQKSDVLERLGAGKGQVYSAVRPP